MYELKELKESSIQRSLNRGGPASRSNPLLYNIPFLRKKIAL